MIYLASPYSDPDIKVRERRFDAVCQAAAYLIRSGKSVYSPIAHTHPICRYGLPGDWRFWQPHDRQYIEMCDEMAVFMLEGWEESEGIQAEIAIARELGKPVTFLRAETANEENPGKNRG
jgi:nucleoside 2-deoxyribosyltransferase